MGNRHFQHFFQTKCLRAELEGVTAIVLWASAFVFHGKRRLPFAELHGIGFADQTQSLGTERQSTHGSHASTDLLSPFVNVFVEGLPFRREAIVFPDPLTVNQHTLAGTKPPMLKCRERDRKAFVHCLYCRSVTPAGRSSASTVTA